MSELPYTIPLWYRWLEKNWLLVPIGLIFVMVVAGIATYALNASGDLSFQRDSYIALPGNPSRFDYQNLDAQTGLLFITHTGDGMITVFDTVSTKVVANIPGIPDVKSALAVSNVGRIFATDGRDNLVYVMNEHSMRIIAKIPVGDAPDGMVYDPVEQKIFVADGGGQSDGVINVQTEQRIAEIPLGGDAGDVEYDAVSHRIFSLVATLNQLVAIDPRTDKITARYTLPGCQSPNDLLIDEQQRLAFVDCADNATLVMVDMLSMAVIASQSVGNNPDLMALDSGWHYLYVASESGVVSVFDEQGRALQRVGEGYVAEGAHSVAVDLKTHDIYFPLQNVNNSPVLLVALF